jgi:mRNA interferase RelE/StbE
MEFTIYFNKNIEIRADQNGIYAKINLDTKSVESANFPYKIIIHNSEYCEIPDFLTIIKQDGIYVSGHNNISLNLQFDCTITSLVCNSLKAPCINIKYLIAKSLIADTLINKSEIKTKFLKANKFTNKGKAVIANCDVFEITNHKHLICDSGEIKFKCINHGYFYAKHACGTIDIENYGTAEFQNSRISFGECIGVLDLISGNYRVQTAGQLNLKGNFEILPFNSLINEDKNSNILCVDKYEKIIADQITADKIHKNITANLYTWNSNSEIQQNYDLPNIKHLYIKCESFVNAFVLKLNNLTIEAQSIKFGHSEQKYGTLQCTGVVKFICDKFICRFGKISGADIHIKSIKSKIGSAIKGRDQEFKDMYLKLFPPDLRGLTPFTARRVVQDLNKRLDNINICNDSYLYSSSSIIIHGGVHLYFGSIYAGSCKFTDKIKNTGGKIWSTHNIEFNEVLHACDKPYRILNPFHEMRYIDEITSGPAIIVCGGGITGNNITNKNSVVIAVGEIKFDNYIETPYEYTCQASYNPVHTIHGSYPAVLQSKQQININKYFKITGIVCTPKILCCESQFDCAPKYNYPIGTEITIMQHPILRPNSKMFDLLCNYLFASSSHMFPAVQWISATKCILKETNAHHIKADEIISKCKSIKNTKMCVKKITFDSDLIVESSTIVTQDFTVNDCTQIASDIYSENYVCKNLVLQDVKNYYSYWHNGDFYYGCYSTASNIYAENLQFETANITGNIYSNNITGNKLTTHAVSCYHVSEITHEKHGWFSSTTTHYFEHRITFTPSIIHSINLIIPDISATGTYFISDTISTKKAEFLPDIAWQEIYCETKYNTALTRVESGYHSKYQVMQPCVINVNKFNCETAHFESTIRNIKNFTGSATYATRELQKYHISWYRTKHRFGEISTHLISAVIDYYLPPICAIILKQILITGEFDLISILSAEVPGSEFVLNDKYKQNAKNYTDIFINATFGDINVDLKNTVSGYIIDEYIGATSALIANLPGNEFSVLVPEINQNIVAKFKNRVIEEPINEEPEFIPEIQQENVEPQENKEYKLVMISTEYPMAEFINDPIYELEIGELDGQNKYNKLDKQNKWKYIYSAAKGVARGIGNIAKSIFLYPMETAVNGVMMCVEIPIIAMGYIGERFNIFPEITTSSYFKTAKSVIKNMQVDTEMVFEMITYVAFPSAVKFATAPRYNWVLAGKQSNNVAVNQRKLAWSYGEYSETINISTEPVHIAMNWIKKNNAPFVVVAHGTKNSVVLESVPHSFAIGLRETIIKDIVGHVDLNATQLSKLIRSAPGYKKQDVFLFSCDTGKRGLTGCLANDLAKQLNVRVIAAESKVMYTSIAQFYVADKPGGVLKSFITFKPERTIRDKFETFTRKFTKSEKQSMPDGWIHMAPPLQPMFNLTFHKLAAKEWNKLGGNVKQELTKKIQHILTNPIIPNNQVHGMMNCYKIKSNGFRVIYQVSNDVKIISIGKRERLEAYTEAAKRLK